MGTDLFRRTRRSTRLLTAAGVVTALALTTGGSSPATAAAAPAPQAHVLARLGPVHQTFAEDLALGHDGRLYVSRTVWGDRNEGRIVTVGVHGGHRHFGPSLDLGPTGMLLGVAAGPAGRVYVAWYDFGGKSRSFVYRVTRNSAARVATLPHGVWPNDLSFHQGRLHVSDSARGSVWRFRPGPAVQHLQRPWVHSPLLRPSAPGGIGVNGIGFRGDDLLAVNADRGTLVRVPVSRSGRAGTPSVVARTHRLQTADGLAVDRHGAWVVTNGVGTSAPPRDQHLLRLDRAGHVVRTWTDLRWMNYPTSVVASGHRLFVTDGAFHDGRADVVALRLAGRAGQRSSL
ncbi:MAG TPA: hypothetical protein VFT70_09555 [Nocardioides sp.]|nr:hypothetical protein [Nocardioides sp.]